MPVSPFPNIAMSVMGRFSGPPTARRSAGRDRELRESIFNELHPAYRNLRDRSNILSADEILCQELKDLVGECDSELGNLFNDRKAGEDEAVATIRKVRAVAMGKIKESKLNRSTLIIGQSQAQQLWAMVNNPSQEEEEELGDRLDQEFENYWKSLKAKQAMPKDSLHSSGTSVLELGNLSLSERNTTKAQSGNSSEVRMQAEASNAPRAEVATTEALNNPPSEGRTPSIRSVDITDLLASSDEESDTAMVQSSAQNVPTEIHRVASAATQENESAESPMISLETVVDKVNGTMRAGKDQIHGVLRSIGNLRQRRKRSEW